VISDLNSVAVVTRLNDRSRVTTLFEKLGHRLPLLTLVWTAVSNMFGARMRTALFLSGLYP